MKNSDISDPVFRSAVEAIDNGQLETLEKLILEHPGLIYQRLNSPEKGYFENPYLIWFIADNPIRHEKLPENIEQITKLLLFALQEDRKDDYQYIVDYTLGLVATGNIPKKCGVQIAMMKILINEGGANVTGSVLGAIGQGNIDAARFLLEKGADYNLATAVGLDHIRDIKQLAKQSSPAELFVALVVASFFGKMDMISFLIKAGVDVNGQAEQKDFGGFHSHASALHQAVSSGSLESVKLLVYEGADLYAVDRIYNGTPLGWSMHMEGQEALNAVDKKKYVIIANFLRSHDK